MDAGDYSAAQEAVAATDALLDISSALADADRGRVSASGDLWPLPVHVGGGLAASAAATLPERILSLLAARERAVAAAADLCARAGLPRRRAPPLARADDARLQQVGGSASVATTPRTQPSAAASPRADAAWQGVDLDVPIPLPNRKVRFAQFVWMQRCMHRVKKWRSPPRRSHLTPAHPHRPPAFAAAWRSPPRTAPAPRRS